MIPVALGLGSLIAKVAAVAVIPRILKALSTLGNAQESAKPTEFSPEAACESVRPPEKVLYGRSLPTENNKRYFGQGVVVGGEKLFYTMDQLGSVRELVDSAGVVRADYRYSTYGERTKVGGDLESDFGFGGLFHHGPSGLDLATYRTYDSKMGRWISRDPLGEGVDYNLYRYCGNNPISVVDPEGLQPPRPPLVFPRPIFRTPRPSIRPNHPNYTPRYRVKCPSQEEIDEYIRLRDQARSTYPDLTGINAHHGIPIYIGGNPSQRLVRLDAAYHQLITNAIRDAFPFGRNQPMPSRQQVVETLGRVHRVLPLIEEYFDARGRENGPRFEQGTPSYRQYNLEGPRP